MRKNDTLPYMGQSQNIGGHIAYHRKNMIQREMLFNVNVINVNLHYGKK